MVDDGPKTGDCRAVDVDEDGQMRARIVRDGKIAGDPLLAEDETHQARSRRKQDMDETAHDGQSIT
jgi:hypothetical protein